MTLEQLKTRCEEQGFQYAYGLFKTPTEPPHLVTISRETDNFIADNKVYQKQTPIQMDYTYIEKNQEDQDKIENNILGEIPWNKTEETYLPDEDVWQVSYFFNI